MCRILIVSAGLVGAGCLLAYAGAARSGAQALVTSTDATALRDARLAFYNGRYVEAADQALAARAEEPEDLAGYELRTSALLFQLKHAVANRIRGDKRAALERCESCPTWLAAFLSDTAYGQALARAQLAADPSDDGTLFFLAKLDLNYVWLQLDTLGRKKGWSEYWEARRSLDALLARNPEHVRGRVARAWIDYIVDTRLPRGTRWLLGGGNRKRALLTLRQAASTDAEFFVQTEAAFALWDMEVRERNLPAAVEVARALTLDFPENRELAGFLALHDPSGQGLTSDTK